MDSDSLIPSNELKPADVEERFYEAWHRVIPRHVYWTSKVMASMTDRQYNLLRAAYWCGSFVTLAFILDRYLENLLDSSANATGLVIFHTYVLFLCVFTMALCPFCFRFLKEVFLSKDIPQLVQMIYKRDRWLKLKFIFFDVFNMIGICISVLIYIIYWDEAMYYKLCLLVYMAVFLWPYCAAYALMLCLLEVHRVYAVQFIADLKNEVCKSEQSSEMDDTENAIGLRSRESNWHVLPTGSVSDLEKSFFSIHNQFYLMSSKRGKVLAFFFLFEILYLVGIVWYTFLVNESGELQIKKTVSLRDILIQATYAIIVMCQLGFLLAHTNETGNLISKELARYLLFRATALSGAELQHANLLMASLDHARVEIPFWGNTVLRVRDISALATSSLVALITAVLHS